MKLSFFATSIITTIMLLPGALGNHECAINGSTADSKISADGETVTCGPGECGEGTVITGNHCKVLCSEDNACKGAIIQVPGGDVSCSAQDTCDGATIDLGSGSMSCTGRGSCARSSTTAAPTGSVACTSGDGSTDVCDEATTCGGTCTTDICPTISPECSPFSGGDPHFKTWNGDKFSFHGECDLVLLQNPNFASGLGMNINIRTTIHKDWSYISSVVVRIGADVLEVKGQRMNGGKHEYWLNGSSDVEFPTTLSGYEVTQEKPKPRRHHYTVDLGNGESISIHTWQYFVALDIHNGRTKSFAGSSGLMGEFGTGQKMARDAETVVEDWNAFGQAWQVLQDEPMLFSKVEGPQHPSKCIMPSFPKEIKRRRLNELDEKYAKEACAHVIDDEKDFCIFDVLATNNVRVAEAYYAY
jgi:hypothetical protein